MTHERLPEDGSKDLAVEMLLFLDREHPGTNAAQIANAFLRGGAATVFELAKVADDPEAVFAAAEDGWQRNIAAVRAALAQRRTN